MTLDEMTQLFEKYTEEDHAFEDIAHKLHRRRDLHAYLLLDQLCPGKGRIVDSAEHDQIWLGADVDMLAGVITEAQIIELVACSLFFDTDVDRISSYV